jgi:hypothetical protein
VVLADPLALAPLRAAPLLLLPRLERKDMATNIFQNNQKSIPMKTPDSFIVRVPMDQSEIAGRKDFAFSKAGSAIASISHVKSGG